MASDTKIATYPLDLAEHFKQPASQNELLSDAFNESHVPYIANSLGIVARARGMGDVAKAAGVTREALYKALSPKGDPRLSTLLGVVKALGFKLTITPLVPPLVEPDQSD